MAQKSSHVEGWLWLLQVVEMILCFVEWASSNTFWEICNKNSAQTESDAGLFTQRRERFQLSFLNLMMEAMHLAATTCVDLTFVDSAARNKLNALSQHRWRAICCKSSMTCVHHLRLFKESCNGTHLSMQQATNSFLHPMVLNNHQSPILCELFDFSSHLNSLLQDETLNKLENLVVNPEDRFAKIFQLIAG